MSKKTVPRTDDSELRRRAEERLAENSGTAQPPGTEEVPRRLLHEMQKHMDRYLEVQRMRFGDRLEVRKEIESATLDCAVPPLVLQPLVENAIRHGIEPLGSPGRVRIEARHEADELVLLVEDDGVGMETPETGRTVNGHGVGLASIRERLVSLYGERGQVVLRGKPGSGVQAEVRLPFHQVRAEAQNVES